jgi:multidrug efflux system membrane fusion protein
VFARLADEEGFPHQGHMNFVDSTLGAETATMRARAVFPNPEEEFAPGMFARIRVPGSARYEALLIPGKAIGRDQARKYVYVLQEGDVIERRLVELGPRACGLRILRKGLKPDERIVIEGLQNARPGEKVDPSAGEFAVRSEDCLADVYDFGDRQYGMTFRDLGDGLN